MNEALSLLEPSANSFGLRNNMMQVCRGEQNIKNLKISLNNIIIPEINFSKYKVDKLYEKFGDLGQFRVKRVEKVS